MHVSSQSKPTLSRVQFCCDGFQRHPYMAMKCKPVCRDGCTNGVCAAPGKCHCLPDHVEIRTPGVCVATCPIGECPLYMGTSISMYKIRNILANHYHCEHGTYFIFKSNSRHLNYLHKTHNFQVFKRISNHRNQKKQVICFCCVVETQNHIGKDYRDPIHKPHVINAQLSN